MPEPQIPEPSPRDRTTLVKLRARQCRFVVGDDDTEAIFCGARKRQGSIWCPWHRRLVYAGATGPAGKEQKPPSG